MARAGALLNMASKKGLVIWLTGLPCSGKSTLAIEIERYFRDQQAPVQRLDGDVVRTTISKDLGFSKRDRDLNIERVAYISQMLSDNGVNVVVAFVSPYRQMRSFARSICPEFLEVYVKCPVEECIRRDVKGMYKQAMAGKIEHFTGVSDVYEEPETPEVTVETDVISLDQCLKQIVQLINL